MTTISETNVENLSVFNINASMSRAELAEIFDSLKAPKINALKGPLKGELLSIEGLRFLPPLLRLAVHAIINSPISPWKGKHFEKGRGGNMLLSSDGSKQIGFYRISRDSALDGTGTVIGLDYDVPENPVIMWPIKGEVREISPNYYLARMLYRTKNRVFTVLYFTLEQ